MTHRCGDCKWHHALDAKLERVQAGQCLALRWPIVAGIVTTDTAECGWPEHFEARAAAAATTAGD